MIQALRLLARTDRGQYANLCVLRMPLNPHWSQTDIQHVVWITKWARNLTALLAAAVCIGIVLSYWRTELDGRLSVAMTKDALSEIRQVISLKVITKDVPGNERGWPKSIERSWFDGLGRTPSNLMVESADGLLGAAHRPWLEIAGPGDVDLTHPRVRVTLDANTAAFWYNPASGVIRARVPIQVTDQQTTQLYNAVNSTSIASALDDR